MRAYVHHYTPLWPLSLQIVWSERVSVSGKKGLQKINLNHQELHIVNICVVWRYYRADQYAHISVESENIYI